MTLYKSLALVLPLAFASVASADTTFGKLKEKTPDYSVAVSIPCDGFAHEVRLDATHLFGPDTDDQGKPMYAPTTDLYVIWWVDAKPTVLEKRDGFATGIEARDIDGDGKPELLVHYAAGGHSNGLLIYKLDGCAVQLLPGADFGAGVGNPTIGPEYVNGYPVIITHDSGGSPEKTPIARSYIWDGKAYVQRRTPTP